MTKISESVWVLIAHDDMSQRLVGVYQSREGVSEARETAKKEAFAAAQILQRSSSELSVDERIEMIRSEFTVDNHRGPAAVARLYAAPSYTTRIECLK